MPARESRRTSVAVPIRTIEWARPRIDGQRLKRWEHRLEKYQCQGRNKGKLWLTAHDPVSTICAVMSITYSAAKSAGPRQCMLGYALLNLLAVFGVLAFILSAVSPGDDDIQQEFFKSRESKQFAFANYKAVLDLRIFRIRSAGFRLAPRASTIASHFVTAPLFVPLDQIKCRVSSSKTGDRSPPAPSV
jgi:hypothetical protein